ncbi:hypothetical protein ACHAPI_009353 [Fusarium lateritium]
MKSTLFSQRLKALNFDQNVKLSATDVHILTGNGPVPFGVDNADSSFGGDRRTQLIGLTLCALAHEIDQFHAVELFMSFLAPHFFGDQHIFKNALNIQLRDRSVLKRILNEGASRGWTDEFNRVTGAASLPLQNIRDSFRNRPFSDIAELHMVAGLLRWVTKEFPGTYKTRSSLTARVALYLKHVGYGIGTIQSCVNGAQQPPQLGPHAVLLVLGGSSLTDNLMAAPQDLNLEDYDRPYGKHYTQETIDIYEGIKDAVSVVYFLNEDGKDWMKGVSVRFEWRKSPAVKPIARSLASIYFPTSHEKVAPFYEPIATDEMLQCARNSSRRSVCPADDELEAAVVKFRAFTASVILALVAQLAPDDFKKKRHCTRMELEDEAWIKRMCSVLDKSIGDENSASIAQAMWLLGAVHTELLIGSDDAPENTTGRPRDLIGYQSGIYTVLLRLLIYMEPSQQAVGLACSDTFFANLEPHSDGSIWGSLSSTVFPEVAGQSDVLTSEITPHTGRWTGEPLLAPPSSGLYLNFERSIHSRDGPLLCFVGRIDGAPLAEIGLLDALKVILLSLNEPAECSHADQNTQVMNVKTSEWIYKSTDKPAGTCNTPTFIPVMGDKAWTVFLAGQE